MERISCWKLHVSKTEGYAEEQTKVTNENFRRETANKHLTKHS